MTSRFVVVNADDFGASDGVNGGVARAHEHGIVTSASFMVRGRAAEAAAAYASEHPALGVGLHVDLAEWRIRDGRWEAVYERVSADDAAAVQCEVNEQLERFRDLLGRDPTHIDSHQHLHRAEPVASVCRRLAAELDVPLRHVAAVRYCGDFYGQDGNGTPLPESISVGRLIAILRTLPRGATEVACHPASHADLEDMYGAARVDELRALCDPAARAALAREDIAVGSFADLRAHPSIEGFPGASPGR